MIKRIVQEDDWGCVAAVAAMILGNNTTYQEAVAAMGEGGNEGKRYLHGHLTNFLLATGFVITEDLYLGGVDTTAKIRSIESMGIKRSPAVVTVASMRFKDGEHVVLWTGSEVLDPNPEIVENLPLEAYDIKAWAPIGWILEDPME